MKNKKSKSEGTIPVDKESIDSFNNEIKTFTSEMKHRVEELKEIIPDSCEITDGSRGIGIRLTSTKFNATELGQLSVNILDILLRKSNGRGYIQ